MARRVLAALALLCLAASTYAASCKLTMAVAAGATATAKGYLKQTDPKLTINFPKLAATAVVGTIELAFAQVNGSCTPALSRKDSALVSALAASTVAANFNVTDMSGNTTKPKQNVQLAITSQKVGLLASASGLKLNKKLNLKAANMTLDPATTVAMSYAIIKGKNNYTSSYTGPVSVLTPALAAGAKGCSIQIKEKDGAVTFKCKDFKPPVGSVTSGNNTVSLKLDYDFQGLIATGNMANVTTV